MAEKEKDELEKMNEALSMSEQFVEKYQKPLLLGLLVVVVIVGAILGVRHFYLLPREDKAQAAMYQAVMAFENDSIDLAINGNEKFDGLLTIVDQRLPVIWRMPIWDWLIMKKGNTKRHRNIFLHSVRTRPCCLLP